MQRLTLYIGLSVIGLVLGILLLGFYDRQIRSGQKPALKVNDTIIKMDYYIELLKLFGQSENPVTQANTAEYTLNFIQDSELIRQASEKKGIIVLPFEIEEALKKARLPIQEDKARNLVLMQLFSKKARDNIALTIPTHATQAYLFSMLVESKEQANEIREKIKKGEDFATLAKQFSVDFTSRGKGGELGWLPRELVDKNVSDVAFSLEPGVVSEPTKRGETNDFWLVKVKERKNNMEISSENREKLISQAFSNWVSQLRKESQIEIYLNEKDKMRALELAKKR